jgi:hypothetical protein
VWTSARLVGTGVPMAGLRGSSGGAAGAMQLWCYTPLQGLAAATPFGTGVASNGRLQLSGSPGTISGGAGRRCGRLARN